VGTFGFGISLWFVKEKIKAIKNGINIKTVSRIIAGDDINHAVNTSFLLLLFSVWPFILSPVSFKFKISGELLTPL
jgi:hypothetical protein